MNQKTSTQDQINLIKDKALLIDLSPKKFHQIYTNSIKLKITFDQIVN